MGATMQVQEAKGDVLALCQYLAGKGNVPVSKLQGKLGSPGVLAVAMVQGFVEVGRRAWTECIAEIREAKGPDGRPVYDENKRRVMNKEMKIRVEDNWSWTNLKGHGRKTVADLLDEDKNLPKVDGDIHLHVRLTNEGLAASAA